MTTDQEKKTNEAKWKEKLTPEQFAITREGATERAFTGKYYDCKETGMYHCVCCDAELFSSETKFDSGSGWPSFAEPTEHDTIRQIVDQSHGMERIEVRCAKCDAHLGHVFDDGPNNGKRYCVNSASLDLKPED